MRPLGRDGQHDRRLPEVAAPAELCFRDRHHLVSETRPERRDVDPSGLDLQVAGDVFLRGLGQREDPPRAARGQWDEQCDTRREDSCMRLRMPLVDHVENRRHLRDSWDRGRRVLHVVQEVDPRLPRRTRKHRLLDEHAPRAASRAHGNVDELDVRGPRLLRQRGRTLVAREHDQLQIPARLEQRGNEAPHVQLAAAGLPRNKVEGVEADAHELVPAVDGEHPLDRGLERQPLAIAPEPVGGRLAQRRPCLVHAENRFASSSGSADFATKPLTPSSISSTAALSGASTTTVGVPTAAASTTTSPYPSRREGKTKQSARLTASSTSSPATKPGA